MSTSPPPSSLTGVSLPRRFPRPAGGGRRYVALGDSGFGEARESRHPSTREETPDVPPPLPPHVDLAAVVFHRREPPAADPPANRHTSPTPNSRWRQAHRGSLRDLKRADPAPGPWAAHAPRRRPRRHPRLPAPRRDLRPRRYDRRLAKRTPVMMMARRVRHGSHDMVADPVTASLDSRRCLLARPEVSRSPGATPPRAAGSISRRTESLCVVHAGAGISPRHPVGRPEGRAPTSTRVRDRAPAAPRAAPRAAALGSWMAQCPAPFLSYTEFRERPGAVRRGGGIVGSLSWGGAGCAHWLIVAVRKCNQSLILQSLRRIRLFVTQGNQVALIAQTNS